MLGPAFVAAVAYIDPGNIATNLLYRRDQVTGTHERSAEGI
jgi:hypothetical protein